MYDLQYHLQSVSYSEVMSFCLLNLPPSVVGSFYTIDYPSDLYHRGI